MKSATIIFTGNRRNDHYEVMVQGDVVELPLACLKVLIELVLARAGAGQGFLQPNPVTVCRLRHAIDHAVGAGAGKALIETGTSDEYRLTIPPEELVRLVALAACFFERVQLNVVSGDYAARLKEPVSNEINKKL